jgi:hypothetical protein
MVGWVETLDLQEFPAERTSQLQREAGLPVDPEAALTEEALLNVSRGLPPPQDSDTTTTPPSPPTANVTVVAEGSMVLPTSDPTTPETAPAPEPPVIDIIDLAVEDLRDLKKKLTQSMMRWWLSSHHSLVTKFSTRRNGEQIKFNTPKDEWIW